MQFKIDENLPVEVAVALKDAGFNALTIHDQMMVGHTDPQIASICQQENRALVTLDLDFADIRTYPPDQYPGIIVLRPRNQAKSTLMSLVAQLIPLLSGESLENKLWILQETGLRIREGS